MKKILLTLFCAFFSTLLIGFFTSCNQNSPDNGVITLVVSPLEFHFPYDNEVHTGRITIKSNTEWTARSTESMPGMTIDKTSGRGNATMTITEKIPDGYKIQNMAHIYIRCQDGTKDGKEWSVCIKRDGEDSKW